MLYWACKRRLDELRAFRELVRIYFANTHFTNMGKPIEQQAASVARQQINLDAGRAIESCTLIGHQMVLNYTPPPASGLSGFNVNVIKELFQFDRLRIPRSVAFDFFDRAIGDYERLRRKLLRQSFNPLFWLWLVFRGLLRIPFHILGAAGFNAQAIEQSKAGKTFKIITAFAGFVLTILGILHALGFSTTWHDIASHFRHK